MVRDYGFLSSRIRGELLQKVYDALEMDARKKPEQPGFAALMKENPINLKYAEQRFHIMGKKLAFFIQNGK